ncbi:MAG: transcription antitermination factor NusG [Bacteroidia bacterium]|jgi:transcription antitermination factor NusG
MNNFQSTYWTAFYTKPRNEKKASDRLRSKGFEVYCPTRTVLKQWSDRKKKVTEPVFNSYLFAKVDESQRLEILQDHGIVSNVRWLGQPARIRENEITQIKAFLDDYPYAEAFSGEYRVGDEISVSSGVLTGQSGVIQRISGNKGILSIASLGLEIHAEISLNNLKKS